MIRRFCLEVPSGDRDVEAVVTLELGVVLKRRARGAEAGMNFSVAIFVVAIWFYGMIGLMMIFYRDFFGAEAFYGDFLWIFFLDFCVAIFYGFVVSMG